MKSNVFKFIGWLFFILIVSVIFSMSYMDKNYYLAEKIGEQIHAQWKLLPHPCNGDDCPLPLNFSQNVMDFGYPVNVVELAANLKQLQMNIENVRYVAQQAYIAGWIRNDTFIAVMKKIWWLENYLSEPICQQAAEDKNFESTVSSIQVMLDREINFK